MIQFKQWVLPSILTRIPWCPSKEFVSEDLESSLKVLEIQRAILNIDVAIDQLSPMHIYMWDIILYFNVEMEAQRDWMTCIKATELKVGSIHIWI